MFESTPMMNAGESTTVGHAENAAMHQNPYHTPVSEASVPPISATDAQPSENTLWEIRKQANNAILAGVVGFVLSVIFSPIAVMCGRQAIQLIQTNGVGQHYEPRARLGIKLGYLGITILLVLLALLITLPTFAVILRI